jgi:hypothetical protein
METTQLPALIDNEQFGNLVNIPSIVDQNKSQALRAVAAISAKAKEIAAMDLATVDAQVMEAKYTELDTLMARGKNTLEQMEARRKPFTGFFDQIRKLFTGAEKDVQDALLELKSSMDAWQREKSRRQQLAQAEIDRKLAEEQAVIRLRAEQFTRYTNKLLLEIGRRIELLSNGFYAQGLTTIDAYAEQLRAMVPQLNGAEYDKIIGEATPLSAELYNQLSSEFMQKIHAERNRLLDLVESRKTELTRIANDQHAADESRKRIEQENKDRQEALKQEQREREQTTQAIADAETMNAMFETAANATPVVGLSKGTRVKKRYTVQSHTGMIALLQSYIKYTLPTLSAEEMNKKFSFVVTAANTRLNDGEVIEAAGLSVEEDFSTTTRRKAV